MNEVCAYCGRRGDDVCDTLPPDVCERAVSQTTGGWVSCPRDPPLSDLVWRRFGRDHDKPCRRPGVITCALWTCQSANECRAEEVDQQKRDWPKERLRTERRDLSKRLGDLEIDAQRIQVRIAEIDIALKEFPNAD